MVDGILTKLRNPVNQDLWLTERFSTSINHPFFVSLISLCVATCQATAGNQFAAINAPTAGARTTFEYPAQKTGPFQLYSLAPLLSMAPLDPLSLAWV